ncbi:energy transducer TonB [Melioribacter sp. OK-6-Me]|uniref:energy transducer TonB n=1 Tax=unclassified Melioribacter TaxID=2627329 RepID=UPI003ED8FE5A
MNDKLRQNSFLASFLLHVVLIVLFAFIHLPVNLEEEDYITVGFGTGTFAGSRGPVTKNEVNEESKEQKVESKKDEKKVELPKSSTEDKDNIVKRADKKNEEKTKEIENDGKVTEENKYSGTEVTGEGVGGFGFELDFGGKGIRKIYSYILPDYPEGVSKEIDVKLKFTILPDGTVGKIIPLIKADAKLEMAAINSLRQWRFEPLPQNAKQTEQTAIITFPYRLQ